AAAMAFNDRARPRRNHDRPDKKTSNRERPDGEGLNHGRPKPERFKNERPNNRGPGKDRSGDAPKRFGTDRGTDRGTGRGDDGGAGNQKGPSKRDAGAPEEPLPPEPRRAARDILTLVEKGERLEEALENARSFAALEGADRGLARAIASTVLRRRGAIDHVVGAYIQRPIPKRAHRAMEILRMAAAQSLFLRTPDHAVVSTSVSLAKQFRETEGYAGLINAVARKVARTGPPALKTLPARVDTPAWLWRSWERAYGPVKAKAIAAAHQREAALDLTPKKPAAADEIAAAIGGSVILGASVRAPAKARVTALPGFDDGAWWVQDAAAAIPARLLGDVAGKRVFDLCAAPGGKTMQLAAAGANVIAVDDSGPRLKKLRENLERVGLEAETVKKDAADLRGEADAEAILLDAPCSATGTIRRHPDILWAKSEDDVAALTALQATLIDAAWRLLKPGGVFVFATCSLQREEGEKQIEAALERLAGATLKPVTLAEVGGLSEAITKDGYLRTLPSMLADQGGIDGFFAARLQKS
ncbi:MAG: transcription antitermination factor NusB, partial [Pseudomonadota bacterium]